MATAVNTSTQQYFGFDPRTIPTCILWLDGADSNTLFSDSAGTTLVGSSGNVGMWKDKSQSSNNYIQATSGSRPSFVSNTITCSTSTQVLQSAAGASVSGIDVFVVGKPLASSAAFRTLFRGSVTDHPILIPPSPDNRLGYYVNSAGTFYPFGSLTLNGSARTLIYLNVPATNIPNCALNGTVAVSTNTAAMSVNATYTAIGSSFNGGQPWGDINEVIFISNMTTNQRQQVEGYLAWKWGLQTNLPVVHPFKNNPTTMRVFQPTDIDTCRLWLDAADANTVQLSSGSNVATWLDKSGFGLNFSQVTSARQPTYSLGTLNGKNGILFTGAGTNGAATMSLSNTNFTLTNAAYSIFVVARQNASSPSYTGYNYLLKGSLTDGFLFFGAHSSKNFATFTGPNASTWNDVNSNSPAVSTSNNPLLMGMVVFSNEFLAPFYNGIQQTLKTGTTGAFTGMVLGDAPFPAFSGQCWNGVICEICIFNSTLTTSQRVQLEGYLTDKWRQAALPTTQAYFSQRALPSTPLFTPTSLNSTSIALWLDAADASTLTTSGTTVTQWRDKSGNSRHMNVGSGTTSYISNSVRLNNSYMFVTTPVNLQNFSFFIVCEAPVPVGGNQVVFSARPNSGFDYSSTDAFGFYVDAAQVRMYGTLTAATSITNALTPSTRFLTSFLGVSAGGLSSFQDGKWGGSAITSARGTTAQGFAIGASWANGFYNTIQSTAYIYEIVLYNTALTAFQRQQVEGYLAWKWGLQTRLPTAPTFTPASVSPAIWLDAADASTFSFGLGSNVSQWRDKSGNSRHYAQATAASQPTRANDTVSTASGRVLINASPLTIGGYDVFVVGKPLSSTATWRTLFRGLDSEHPIIVETGSTRLGTFIAAGAFQQFGQAGQNLLTLDGTQRTLIYLNIPTSRVLSASLNGVIPTSTTANGGAALAGTNFYALGNIQFGDQPWGDINEVIIIPNTTLAVRKQIEEYLAWKWSVQLPSSIVHPYTKFRP